MSDRQKQYEQSVAPLVDALRNKCEELGFYTVIGVDVETAVHEGKHGTLVRGAAAMGPEASDALKACYAVLTGDQTRAAAYVLLGGSSANVPTETRVENGQFVVPGSDSVQ